MTVEAALDARRGPWLREHGTVRSGHDVLAGVPASAGSAPVRIVACDDVATALGAVVAATRAGAVPLLWPGRTAVPDWLSALAMDPPEWLAAGDHGPLVGVASSGTTGRGKVVVLDQGRAVANATAVATVLGDVLAGARVASLRSAAYAAGFVGDLLATLVADGAEYLPPAVTAPVLAARALRSERVGAVHASAAVVRAVAADLPPGVRHAVLSGDRITPAAVRLVLPVADLWCGYGLAEAGPRVTLGRCPDGAPAGYAGPPLPGVSVDTADGEILVRTPYQAIAVLDPGGCRVLGDAGTSLATGDGGRLDGGALVVAGRLAQSLTVDGVTVFCDDVEVALGEHGVPATVGIAAGRCRVAVPDAATEGVARSVLRRRFPLLPSVEVVVTPTQLTDAGKVRR